jgi:hypothetical protein
MSSFNDSYSAPYVAISSTDRGGAILIVDIIGLVIALFSVCVRIYLGKRDLEKGLGFVVYKDDLFCYITTVSNTLPPMMEADCHRSFASLSLHWHGREFEKAMEQRRIYYPCRVWFKSKRYERVMVGLDKLTAIDSICNRPLLHHSDEPKSHKHRPALSTIAVFAQKPNLEDLSRFPGGICGCMLLHRRVEMQPLTSMDRVQLSMLRLGKLQH